MKMINNCRFAGAATGPWGMVQRWWWGEVKMWRRLCHKWVKIAHILLASFSSARYQEIVMLGMLWHPKGLIISSHIRHCPVQIPAKGATKTNSRHWISIWVQQRGVLKSLAVARFSGQNADSEELPGRDCASIWVCNGYSRQVGAALRFADDAM